MIAATAVRNAYAGFKADGGRFQFLDVAALRGQYRVLLAQGYEGADTVAERAAIVAELRTRGLGDAALRQLGIAV